MSRETTFNWDDHELRIGVDKFKQTVQRAIIAATDRNAALAEGWMKTNAPWVDRTGNARNGLRVTNSPLKEGGVRMTFSHSMPYGLFLEVRYSGRYAIIQPAITHWFPQTQRLIFRLLG